MKILFVTPYFVPAWSFGGPVKVVYELSKQLILLGHEVTVVTTDVLTKNKRHQKRTDSIDGAEVIYFRNISNTLAFRFNFYFPFGFRKWLKNNLSQYDIVHCHDLFTWLNVEVSRLAPKYNIPFIIQPHGALNKVRMAQRLSFFKSFFLTLYPRILSLASVIIVSTEREKNEEIKRVIDHSEKNVQVVPNGLAASQISQPHRSTEFRDRLKIEDNEKIIIYFGRFQYIKGIDITIRALALIKEVPLKFILIGRDEGALPQIRTLAVELGIDHRLIVLGTIFGQDLAEYLSNADLFVFNSRSEGLPMAVLDACAAGLPSVISPDCNIPEVGDYGAGIVLKYNTPEATATAIRHFFSDANLPMRMSAQCHKLIVNYFNLDIIAKKYISIYRNIITNSK